MASAIAILTAAGCSTILAVKGQQKLADTNGMISGSVATEKPPRGPLIVGLFNLTESRDSDEVLNGLKPNDQVITGPYNSVRNIADGDAVKIDNKQDKK